MVAYTRYVYDGYGDISFKVISRYVDGALADMIERPVYTYTNGTWSHMLTDYNGQAITYDAIGNPLSYRGATLTWENGRQLASYTKGDTSISYTYDADGLRTSKTVNGTKHDYYYLDGKLVYEGIGTDDILYYYDSYGTFAGLQYFPNGSNGVMYYAATNMQGDVIGLYDSTGALVVSYEYDAWGKLLSITDTTTIGIGAINPIRYRSYYYDSETGLYYLQSRYYDPETCRFINADGYVSTGQGVFGHNPYLYCGNNPIMRVDPTGACYYANGYWTHDKWELIGAYERRPDPQIVAKQQQLLEMGFKNVDIQSAEAYLSTLRTNHIETVEQEAHFLAQCAYETNFGMWLTEIGSESYFADKPYGYKYRGAGYIQLTWDYNYASFAAAMNDNRIYEQGADFVAENYAWQAAGWFWTNNSLNAKIANGASVYDITCIVRGGAGTWEIRQRYYDRFWGILT